MNEWKTVNKFPPRREWKYENEGDSVQGVYKEKKVNVGKNSAIVYLLEDATGSEITVWDTAGLNNLFNDPENAPKIGQEVRIVYLGKKVNKKSGRTFKDFKMDVRDYSPEDSEDGEKGKIDNIPF